MIMLPMKSIIFFLAMLFLPQDAVEFTATIDNSKIQWVKKGNAWLASDVKTGKALGTFHKKGNKVIKTTAKGKKENLDFAKLFKLSKRTKVDNVEMMPLDERNGFGLPVMVTKKKNQIVLSQAKGVIFHKPIVIQ